MNLINSNLGFRDGLSYGNNAKMIILHHADSVMCSIDDIHKWHLDRGWSGCGYHYFVRKDGRIYIGRPEKALGAHCLNYNAIAVGICAEGNFNVEIMKDVQYNALLELTRSIYNKYTISRICGHGELNSTDCPGMKFPLERIKREVGNGSLKISYPGYLIKIDSNVKDESVRLIQSKLIDKGYNVGGCRADGYFGEDTLAAVKRFQGDNGLTVDGIVGENTWNELIG